MSAFLYGLTGALIGYLIVRVLHRVRHSGQYRPAGWWL